MIFKGDRAVYDGLKCTVMDLDLELNKATISIDNDHGTLRSIKSHPVPHRRRYEI